jgi:hypothetical protein
MAMGVPLTTARPSTLIHNCLITRLSGMAAEQNGEKLGIGH